MPESNRISSAYETVQRGQRRYPQVSQTRFERASHRLLSYRNMAERSRSNSYGFPPTVFNTAAAATYGLATPCVPPARFERAAS